MQPPSHPNPHHRGRGDTMNTLHTQPPPAPTHTPHRGGQNLEHTHTYIYILNIHTYAHTHMYTKKSSSSRAMFFSRSIQQCVCIYIYMYLYLYVIYNAYTYYIKDRNSHAGLGPVLTICPHLCFPNLQG